MTSSAAAVDANEATAAAPWSDKDTWWEKMELNSWISDLNVVN